MIHSITRSEDRSHLLDIWVSGASLLDEDSYDHKMHNEEIFTSREVVQDTIDNLGSKNSVNVNWLDDKQSIAVLTFDPMADKPINIITEATKL